MSPDPASTLAPPRRAAGPASAAPPTLASERSILVVDDEPRLRELAARTLDDHSPVTAAASCAEALALLRTHEVSLVLADYTLPDGDGLALLTAVRALDRDLPFILWSAALPSDVRRRAAALGATVADRKPIGTDLAALVDRILNSGTEAGHAITTQPSTAHARPEYGIAPVEDGLRARRQARRLQRPARTSHHAAASAR